MPARVGQTHRSGVRGRSAGVSTPPLISLTAPQFNDAIGALTGCFNRMLQFTNNSEANFRARSEIAEDGILIIEEEGATVYAPCLNTGLLFLCTAGKYESMSFFVDSE